MPVRKDFVSIKASKSRLKGRNKELSLILDLSNFLSASLHLQEILEGAISQTLEYFCLEAGRIYLMDWSGKILTLAACKGIEPKGLERIEVVSDSFSGKAVRTGSFIAQNIFELEDKDRADILARHGFKFVVCVPLMVRDKIIGVMNLTTGRNIRLTQNDIDLLIAIGNQVAIAADHANLFEDILKKQKTMEFITYSISHDLKSPAVGAHGLAALLVRKYGSFLDEQGRNYCEQILRATEQIAGLVEDMKAYIGAKEASLNIEVIDVKEITAMLRSEFVQKLDQGHVRWCEPETVPPIRADRSAIVRVLQNLVDNALKYGGDGLSEIKIGYHDNMKYHILSVSNDGTDIQKCDLERVFGMFQRGSMSKGAQGTGLGLAIVKAIAEAHHGKAWADSEPNKGTTFYVSIAKDLGPLDGSR